MRAPRFLVSGLLIAWFGANVSAAERDEAAALAARIDALIAQQWAAHHVQPAAPASDEEFLRRVYLDLAGRIPRVSEARDFLDDPTPTKRGRLIERLLVGPGYVQHFTHVWRDVLLGEAANQQRLFTRPAFERWLQRHLRDNTPYDRLVREILTVPLATEQRNDAPGQQPAVPSPLAFYQANELKPENLAAATSRVFLGVKLECAQCHDHPFAQWKRKQFWEFAAFYASIRASTANVFAHIDEDADRRELTIPGTEKVVQARLLDGREPRWQASVRPRVTLAEWVTSANNPYFARTAVNRLWAHCFGRGLIDPVDGLDAQNLPSHPELLDELAQQFVAHGYDVKFLLRALVNSRTYQLSSTAAGPDQPRLLAQMPLKGLTPEQFFDSLAQATGYRESTAPRFFGEPSPRADFLARFRSHDPRTEQQTSILQALLLMNGKFIDDATGFDRSEVLAAVADAPFLKTKEQKIEALYLATLSRRPRPEELQRSARYVASGGDRHDARLALGDVLWALLNSSEFMFNH